MEIVSPLSEFPLAPSTPPPTPNSHYMPNFSKTDILMTQQKLKLEQGTWSVPDKLVLQQKITQCSIRKEAHWDTARNCAKKDKLLTIPKLILSTILASTLTLLTQEEDNKILEYFTTGTSIIVAVLTTVGAFLDYNVEKTKHRTSSLNYGKLAAHIDRVLRLPPDERQSFGETLAKVNEQYAEIRRESPFMKSSIIKNYIKTFATQENSTSTSHQNDATREIIDNDNENVSQNLISLDRRLVNMQLDLSEKERQNEVNYNQIKLTLDTILSCLPHKTYYRNSKKLEPNSEDIELSTCKIKTSLENTILSDLIGPNSGEEDQVGYNSPVGSVSEDLSKVSETDKSI